MRLRATLLLFVLAVSVVGPSITPAAAQPAGPTITEQVVDSFDGTPIITTFFVPSGADATNPVPLVLMTHGWGGTGQTDAGGFIGKLLDAGYAVLTWDQRGFGCSGGEVHIDNPEVEGRDVSALIDWAVAHGLIATDDTGDPVVGATGGSYAGGIQTATASLDPRLDALAPEVSWSDLRYSLNAGGVVNQGWVLLLYLAGQATAAGLGLSPDCPAGPQTGGLNPALLTGLNEFLTTGEVSDTTLDFFAQSSLAAYGNTNPVDVPTLVMNGSVDTLFDLTDGYGIVEHVRAQGAPTRFIAFCGGHVACPASYGDAGDREHLESAVLTWFAKYLKGEDVDTGPPVEYRTNEGVWRALDDFPTGSQSPDPLTGSGSATSLPVVPIVDIPDLDSLANQLANMGEGIPALPITAASPAIAGDPRAATFELAAAGDQAVDLLGTPEVSLTVSGLTLPLEQVVDPVAGLLDPLQAVGQTMVGDLGDLGALGTTLITGLTDGAGLGSEVNVFVRLIDREAGEVVNLQEGAVRVDLSDGPSTVSVPMPGVAYTLAAGHHLDLQISTASLMNATGRTPAIIDVSAEAVVPAFRYAAPPTDTPGNPQPAPDAIGPAPGPQSGPGTLPATGAGGVPVLALFVLVAAVAVRWLRAQLRSAAV